MRKRTRIDILLGLDLPVPDAPRALLFAKNMCLSHDVLIVVLSSLLDALMNSTADQTWWSVGGGV